MERRRHREIAFAAVALIAIGVAAYRIRSMMPGAASALSVPTGAMTRQTPGQGPLADVDLQALKNERPEPVEGQRNPFRFRSKPTPPPVSPDRPTAALPQPGPAGTPPPPRIPLKFIGVIDSPVTGRVAVLSDSRGVYQGREGETVEGRYRILKIGVESIDLAYLDGRGRQTIRLTGQ
jgi:hypothetical protein